MPRAASTPTNPRYSVMRELWEETGVVNAPISRNRLADLLLSAVSHAHHHIAWQNSAAAAEIVLR